MAQAGRLALRDPSGLAMKPASAIWTVNAWWVATRCTACALIACVCCEATGACCRTDLPGICLGGTHDNDAAIVKRKQTAALKLIEAGSFNMYERHAQEPDTNSKCAIAIPTSNPTPALLLSTGRQQGGKRQRRGRRAHAACAMAGGGGGGGVACQQGRGAGAALQEVSGVEGGGARLACTRDCLAFSQ